MLLADGFEDAVIGYIETMREPRRVVYDREKCIQILMNEEHGGLDREEAEDYFEYNVAGSYVGEMTPVYMITATVEEIHELADA